MKKGNIGTGVLIVLLLLLVAIIWGVASNSQRLFPQNVLPKTRQAQQDKMMKEEPASVSELDQDITTNLDKDQTEDNQPVDPTLGF